MIGFIIGLFVGGVIGVVIMCIIDVAGQSDRNEEVEKED